MVEDAHQTSKDILGERREQLDTISKILLERETIEAEEFIALLEGKPEEEVFSDEQEEAKPPEAPPVEEKSTAREGARPRPRPRPGLAGGSAEMRANDPNR